MSINLHAHLFIYLFIFAAITNNDKKAVMKIEHAKYIEWDYFDRMMMMCFCFYFSHLQMGPFRVAY